MRCTSMWLIVALLIAAAAPRALAQTSGRVAIGISTTRVVPSNADLKDTEGVGLVVRQVPRPGWGVAGALNWFAPDVDGSFAGVNGKIGTLRVRPLMGGASYTLIRGRLATSLSLVGGPAFNRLRLDDTVRDRVQLLESDAENIDRRVTFAVRPGVNVAYALAPRFALTGFGGYLFNRPEFILRSAQGDTRHRLSADAVVLSIGVAVGVF